MREPSLKQDEAAYGLFAKLVNAWARPSMLACGQIVVNSLIPAVSQPAAQVWC